MGTTRKSGRGPWWVVATLGLGLVAAPAVFQMFTRAPAGGQMLTDFEPYMDEAVLDGFASDLGLIDRAVDAARTEIDVPGDASADLYLALDANWDDIHAEMGDMLATISDNLGNYRAVRALPPFALFPWFFVLPGLALAALGVSGLRRPHRGTLPASVAALGVAIALAPVVFQMFDRAPKGADMIDELRPWMTLEDVRTMQSHFVVIGGGEGNLRNDLVPASSDVGAEIATLFEQWPRISAEMAPMIGAMSDNVKAFQGIDALPNFALFPWFFVLPGLAAVGAAGAGARRGAARPLDPSSAQETTHVPTQGATHTS